MSCGRALPFELGFGETQRLNFANTLGIGGCCAAAPLALGLPLLHLLLNTSVRVDEAFSGITHKTAIHLREFEERKQLYTQR